MLQFPSNLRLIRLVSGKSQTDFGSSFGATKAMIVSYEKAKANPDELFISRVARYAGVSETDLKNKKLEENDLKPKQVEKEEIVEEGAIHYKAARTSLERTLENLSEDKLKSTAIIERLVTLENRRLLTE